MQLSFHIRQLLKDKSGKSLLYSSDCEYLALDIESVTGEHIGVNTLKRLLGMIADEREPRISTLDILARYLGYESWAVLSALDDKSNSSFSPTDGELRVADIIIGTRVKIAYLPDRQLTLLYQGHQTFLVEASTNSKLQVGDEVEIHHFVLGYPLLVSNVIRQGQSLGTFTAGQTSGLTELYADFNVQ